METPTPSRPPFTSTALLQTPANLSSFLGTARTGTSDRSIGSSLALVHGTFNGTEYVAPKLVRPTRPFNCPVNGTRVRSIGDVFGAAVASKPNVAAGT